MKKPKYTRINYEERVKKKKNFPKTTNSMHLFRKHPNLIAGLDINGPEQVWVSDITYIRTKWIFR